MLLRRLRFYLLVLHGAVGLILGAVFWGSPWLLLVEMGFLISILVGWRLVDALLVPLRLVETGTDLIAERDFTTTFVPVGQPEMDRLIEVYNRMIEVLRDERIRSREQEDFLDRLIDASPAGVLICELGGAVMRLNPAGRRLIGGPFEGKTLGELPAPWGTVLPDLQPGDSATLSLSGGERVRCRAAAFKDRGFSRRFLMLEELTEELRRSEKAAYEKLIRMISHEVNNSSGAVLSLLGALAHYAPALIDDDRSDFEHALDIAGGRLERLTAFINGFAEVVRLPEPCFERLDLDGMLDELLDLYRPSIEERKIRLERRRGAAPLFVSADRQQIEQVVLNVLKNAAEAIGGDGTLEVESRLEADGPRLVISDDGPGVDPKIAAELFTPFFTTKTDGCGLGLTLSKEILTQHGATFALESREGPLGGSRFSIRFPPLDITPA